MNNIFYQTANVIFVPHCLRAGGCHIIDARLSVRDSIHLGFLCPSYCFCKLRHPMLTCCSFSLIVYVVQNMDVLA